MVVQKWFKRVFSYLTSVWLFWSPQVRSHLIFRISLGQLARVYLKLSCSIHALKDAGITIAIALQCQMPHVLTQNVRYFKNTEHFSNCWGEPFSRSIYRKIREYEVLDRRKTVTALRAGEDRAILLGLSMVFVSVMMYFVLGITILRSYSNR